MLAASSSAPHIVPCRRASPIRPSSFPVPAVRQRSTLCAPVNVTATHDLPPQALFDLAYGDNTTFLRRFHRELNDCGK